MFDNPKGTPFILRRKVTNNVFDSKLLEKHARGVFRFPDGPIVYYRVPNCISIEAFHCIQFS